MDGRYKRAMAIGPVFGLLLTGVNLFSYWLYQKTFADFWNAPGGPRSGVLCLGMDSYYILIALSILVYAAGGIFMVRYARGHLDRQVYVARALLIESLGAALVAMIATAAILTILSPVIAGGFPPGTRPPSVQGWVVVCALCAVPGTVAALVAGVSYYRRSVKPPAKSPP